MHFNSKCILIVGLSATQLSDPQEIVNAFKQAELSELESMRQLRSKNISAIKINEESGVSMLDCELCKEQFQPGIYNEGLKAVLGFWSDFSEMV